MERLVAGIPNRQFRDHLRVMRDFGCWAHAWGADVSCATALYQMLVGINSYEVQVDIACSGAARLSQACVDGGWRGRGWKWKCLRRQSMRHHLDRRRHLHGRFHRRCTWLIVSYRSGSGDHAVIRAEVEWRGKGEGMQCAGLRG